MGSNVVEWILKLTNQVSGPAAAASVSTRRLATDSATAGAGIGKLGAAMGPLGGILSRVSPELGATASSIAGLTSASTTAAAGLGISAGLMGVALGAAVAAAAPFIGALVVMQRESDEAAARMAFLAEHGDDLTAATRSLTDAQTAQLVATGSLTEAQGKLATLEEARDRAVADFAKTQEKERQAAEASIDTMERQQHYLGLLPGFLSVAVDHYAGFTSAGREAMGVIEGLNAIEAEHTGVVYETTDARKAEAKATEEARKAEERKEKADRIAIDNAKKHADAIKEQTAAHEKWREEYAKEKLAESGNAAAKAGADYLRERVLVAEMEAESAAEVAAAAASWADSSEKAGRDARRAQEIAALNQAGTVVGAMQDPMGALAKIDPRIGIVIAVMEAIANLDETLKRIGDFVQDFRKGLETAPKAFGDFIVKELGRGDLMVGALTTFVDESIKQIPRILEAIAGSVGAIVGAVFEEFLVARPGLVVTFFEVLFDPDTWVKAGEALLDGFAKGFENLFDATKQMPQASPDVWTAPNGQTYYTGVGGIKGSHADGADYVDKTGLYMLHRGERVDTASRTQREASGSSSGSGSGRMVGRGGKVYIEIDADSLSDTFGGLRGRGYAL